jgi:hypothetical protein
MWILILFGIIPFILFASEDSGNQVWIEKNLITVFDSLGINNITVSDTVNLDFGVVEGEQKGFLKNLLIHYLEHYVVSTNPNSDKTTIRIEQFETGIVYEQNSKGFLGLETETIRENKISISGWIENIDDKKIQKSIILNKIFTDTLETGNITNLENSPYSFTKGIMNKHSLWTKIVEPVLVVSSVATIVYLFFTVRS